MSTDTLDARKTSCTALQRCEVDDLDRPTSATFDGTPVTHYGAELARRSEPHVFGCTGIYPTSFHGGVAQYAGPVCIYGTADEATFDGPDAA